ncbi:phosphoethanolamine--lipid A transferase [Psychrosphaera sp. 1_MG-2023]|uniref:phosphoethanolamine transferase n=1 Tax=Psychrosphaera sp. 1_MG-2023 TaxID=3062643 RepID=UPI0026E323F1|nr:phosphoethanolamine--lipid A transferase [Psychrosphaera sp. 1_MG-2023]MDO6718642.1 phosphoethanolamine--lipid A transferase [Psychrosphaera sp. 1_MG-2023]
MNKVILFFKNTTVTANQVVFASCCYIALILNLPFLTKTSQAIIEVENYNVFFLCSVPLFLLNLTVLFQAPLAIKWLTKPILILTTMTSALIFYGTVSYGIVFDYGMVQNSFETDTAEALSYLNFYAVLFFAIFGLLPAGIIYLVNITYKPFFQELLSRLKLLSLSFLCATIIAALFYSHYASVGRNNKDLIGYITPYKMVDATQKFIKNTYFYSPLKFKTLDATPTFNRVNKKKHVTVLILGETARAQNFALNGYDKPTNPYTKKLGVVSFSNMYSCGTATAISVPCMFSRLNKSNYSRRLASAQQNALDIVQQAGADVVWISNNNGSCKGVCARIETTKIPTYSDHELCDGEYCYDEILLEPLKAKLSQLDNNNTFIVLHMIGSHGPTYYRRYPQSKQIFLPDCQRSDLQNCNHKEVVNTYNNTIAYTDFVIAKTIEELKLITSESDIETSLLYISDHGESLGENGVYLHGLPYAFAPKEQIHVPMIYWSNNMASSFDPTCLTKVAKKKLTHDIVFDLIMNIAEVKTTTYNAKNDPLKTCRL